MYRMGDNNLMLGVGLIIPSTYHPNEQKTYMDIASVAFLDYPLYQRILIRVRRNFASKQLLRFHSS